MNGPSRDEVAVRHGVAQAKVAEAIKAIEKGDEGWQDQAREALPAMRSFSTGLQEWALAELERLDEEQAERERLEARPWWKKVLRLER